MLALLLHSLIGRLIGGLVTVAIAAGAYFLVIEPQLDNANDVIDKQVKQSERQSKKAQRQGERRARRGERVADDALSQAERLTRCLSQASGDPAKIQDCTRRLGR